jgi:hypothetical protein
MKLKLAALALALSGCATTVTTPEGAKVSEGMYAYTLAIDAHKEATLAAKETANAAATCDAAVASGAPVTKPLSDIGQALEALRTIGGLAVCTSRVAGSSNNVATTPVPTYVAPPTMLDRVVQLAPVALGLGNLIAGDRANARQNDTAVLLAAENTKREVGLLSAAVDSNRAIATGGFTAVGGVAASGLTSIRDVANANSAAMAAALAAATAKPTNQVTVRGNYNQAEGDITIDESVTGRNRVNGSGNRLENAVDCTATTAAPTITLGGLSAQGMPVGTTGVTNPLTAIYNPFVDISTAPVTNDCGNG